MATEDAFVAALLDAPGDEATRLVYADWLEERGDARADAVRAHPELFAFLSGLRSTTDETKMFDTLGGWVFGGRIDLVRSLRRYLACHPSPARTIPDLPGMPGSRMAALFTTLTPLAMEESAAPHLRWLRDNPPTTEDVLATASRLAYERPPGDLFAILEAFADEAAYLEFLGCLSHEMVLRGFVLDGLPAAEGVSARLRESGHPLGRLPLHLTAAEGDLRRWLPRYAFGGRGRAPLFGAFTRPTATPLGQGPAFDGVIERDDVVGSEGLHAAVRTWSALEGQVFNCSDSLTEEDLSAGLLLSLGLDCLYGATEGDIRAERVTACDVFADLFSASSTGTGHMPGRFGAHGRLEAMRSLGALVGVDTSVDVIASAACCCLWVRFEARTAWFHQVTWDLGLLAVRPDRMSIAVLAATDTD